MIYSVHIKYMSGRDEYVKCQSLSDAQKTKKTALKMPTVYAAKILRGYHG